jgi:hypothetical protein
MSYKAARCKRARPRGGETLQNGIRANSRGFTGTYRRKCTGMWTGAWRVGARASGMCRWHWTHGRRIGTIGIGCTDVAHGPLALNIRYMAKRGRSWLGIDRRGRRSLKGVRM